MTPIDKPYEEQTLVERLRNRALIRRNVRAKDDRIAELLEEAARVIVELENELIELKARVESLQGS